MLYGITAIRTTAKIDNTRPDSLTQQLSTARTHTQTKLEVKIHLLFYRTISLLNLCLIATRSRSQCALIYCWCCFFPFASPSYFFCDDRCILLAIVTNVFFLLSFSSSSNDTHTYIDKKHLFFLPSHAILYETFLKYYIWHDKFMLWFYHELVSSWDVSKMRKENVADAHLRLILASNLIFAFER